MNMNPAIGPSIDLAPILLLAAEGTFYVLLFLFTLHVVVLGYHWFSYGTRKRMSMLALATYLIGGAVLFLVLALLLGTLN